ncbi:hypothetical protein [Pseudonocardia humida]|uniref:DUF3558 domain-containing protein n=1 Tax=Pseudonocardia humida TaxID=2800819 RepID=A0ABT1A731_9PSEU|nr:hypothetical protein [Pseudonocardia humida]MCO1658808.1 hypothetical protein [Pseudonocardia humida]
MSAPPARSRSALLGAALLALGAVGCTTTAAGTGPTAGGPSAAPTPPPPPPAACLLDLEAMADTTGLTWTPDATTASDTRCVYDPGPGAPTAAAPAASAADGADTGTGLDRAPTPAPARSGEFVAVDIAAADDRAVAAQLDVLAEVCDAGSRAPVGTGFVCRLDGSSVYAGLVRGEDVITVAASAVPPGTTVAALTMAIGQQVDALS